MGNYPQKGGAKNQVKPERTFWRDQHLSERHRKWGLAVPAVDIDFLLIEYDRGRPTAIIEYKIDSAAPQYPSHPSYIALIRLGDLSGLPVFAVRYRQDFSSWTIIPLNAVAKRMVPERVEVNEQLYVTWLYNIRGLKPPQEIFQFLNTAI